MTDRFLSFVVYGTPAPQGSKRHVGGGRMIESSKKVKPWREAVKHAALDAIGAWQASEGRAWHPIDAPIVLRVTFVMARPASAPKRVIYPAKTPDLSKLIRSTEDAMTDAGVWKDDSRVVRVEAWKLYVGHEFSRMRSPGAEISVSMIE